MNTIVEMYAVSNSNTCERNGEANINYKKDTHENELMVLKCCIQFLASDIICSFFCCCRLVSDVFFSMLFFRFFCSRILWLH